MKHFLKVGGFPVCLGREEVSTLGGSDAAFQNPKHDLRDHPLTPGDRNNQGISFLAAAAKTINQ